MFIGEYDHNLDGKNRLSIPSKFREIVEGGEEAKGFYVTLGLDTCLFLFTASQWERVTSALRARSFTDANARKFQRIFYSNAVYVDIDRQGRVLIPESLKVAAQIARQVSLVGVDERIEVWDRARWKSSKEAFSGEYETLAAQLL